MSISAPPAARYRLRDFLFCASLGCLCFIRRWFDLKFFMSAVSIYRSAPLGDSICWWAHTLFSFDFASCSACAMRVRCNNPHLTAIARCVALLVIAVAVESMRRY